MCDASAFVKKFRVFTIFYDGRFTNYKNVFLSKNQIARNLIFSLKVLIFSSGRYIIYLSEKSDIKGKTEKQY